MVESTWRLIKFKLYGPWLERYRAGRMSWDDIESENSLFTLASTSLIQLHQELSWWKSAPKRWSLTRCQQATSYSSIQQPASPRIRGNKGSELGEWVGMTLSPKTHYSHSLALHLIQLHQELSWWKSAPKQTKVKFNTTSTNDQLFFHSTTSLTPYQRQQKVQS